MKNDNFKKIEEFFDVIDESTMFLYEKHYSKYNQSKEDEHYKNYLECLIYTLENIINGEVADSDLNDEDIKFLDDIYMRLQSSQFTREEMRRAVQLSLLKGIKHASLSNSVMTPDTIGILFSFIINILFKDATAISIADTAVGTGNLLMTILNNINVKTNEIYGIDKDIMQVSLARVFFELNDYDTQLICKDALLPQYLPKMDLIIGDLPTYYLENDEMDIIDSNLGEDVKYSQYHFIEQNTKYLKPDGYLMYVIDNDFFDKIGNEEIKDLILRKLQIRAIIALPEDMFKSKEHVKSIFIMQKRSENMKKNSEVLVLNLPSITETERFKDAIDKIEDWYKRNQ